MNNATRNICVIGFLSALFFIGGMLGLTRYSRSSNQVLCIKNLHAISQALELYASDNNGYLPQDVSVHHNAVVRQVEADYTWQDSLEPYFKGEPMPICSSRKLTGGFGEFADEPRLCGYALNAEISGVFVGVATPSLHPSKSVSSDSTIVLVYDARLGIISGEGPDATLKSGKLGLFMRDFRKEMITQSNGSTRHNGGANYLFLDGHVKWLKPLVFRDLTKKDSDPTFAYFETHRAGGNN